MRCNVKRKLVAGGIVGEMCGPGTKAILASCGAATARALSALSNFRANSALGEERAGFSGRFRTRMSTASRSKEWPAISPCLKATAVRAELGLFADGLVLARVLLRGNSFSFPGTDCEVGHVEE